ncbi:RNA polymerase sigma factor [Saccharothrix algeriensis]|uniref:RNA polymerase sigma-70 factor (ECF subfamily) n=1 Tax=Saccharothrix algeriensis TaxID=173560 RepID=A0A8T8HU91_9PSEU|nr:sigma-70 family RNA polymerase sigma factor [Saccharothrix algeriensis]MBM7813567.1 RNA polymerase sigma-70 factor (ECF subfamily) [Saccharothrix algeriensis]QTR02062.1 sigma-70 family RNA polymerase sigma factor [Saccharothrix algeriensis]
MTPEDSDDHAATFADFYHRERTRLFRFAAVMSPHLDHESAVQEAFVRAWRHWPSISPPARRAWLVKATRNLLVDQARRRERPGEVTDEVIARSRLLVQRHRDAEAWHELTSTLAAIARLPDRLRTALVLRFWDFTDDEIADVLGCGRDTVRRYVTEARALIAEEVGNPERRARGSRRGKGTR